MPEAFHFLTPGWFYLLVPFALIFLILLKRNSDANDPWLRVIDKDLMPWLRVKSAGGSRRYPLWLLTVGWLIAMLALANPVWEKLPQPVFQTDTARVIVLDMSLSMNSTDLKPTRIDRAKFKVSDILELQQEGVIGLVVFAGDAFVVSPLTRDGETISAQLPALKPDIMPVQGSRADLGLLKAGELLKQAGRVKGEVLLLADSYTDQRTLEAARKLHKQGVVTSVLGVGTVQGAPLPTGHGDFVRNDSGEVITTRLDALAMEKLASSGGGEYVSLTTGNADINRLIRARVESTRSRTDDAFNQTIRWKESGPWLVLLLLPLAAFAFRRGWLFSIALLVITGLPAEPAMAFTMTDLWQRKDQQAHKALVAGDLENAAKLAQDPLRKGVAEYKQGNYDQAVKDFSSLSSADAAYNTGNALAKMGNYEDAIEAYEQALQQQADMEDARYNKEAVEKLLQQQQDQQQQQGQEGQQGEKDSGQNSTDNDDHGQSAEGKPEQSESQENENQQEKADSASQSDGAASDDKNAFADAAQQATEQADDKDGENSNATAQENPEKEKEQGAVTAEDEKGSQQEAHDRKDQSMAEGQREINPADVNSPSSSVEELSSEEQIAAEQWLRRIPDDTAGLLRRKLRYQYIQRGGQSGNPSDADPW